MNDGPRFRWWLPGGALAILIVAVWFRVTVVDADEINLPCRVPRLHNPNCVKCHIRDADKRSQGELF